MSQDAKEHLERGDLASALALANAAADAELRISILLELGRYDEALEALRAECAQHPRSTRLWFVRAQMAEKMQYADEAHAAYVHLRRLQPRHQTIRALMRAHFESLGETFIGG